MNTRPIPHSDLTVSTLCLGTMTFGNPVGEDEAVGLVHWALDHGINFFDTADMYEGYDRKPGSAGGIAERILGLALDGRRNQAVITTKAGSDVGPGSGLSREHLFNQAEASLRRLRSDRIDIFQMHRPDPAVPIEQSIAAMASLIEAGKIRCWGFSNFDTPWVLRMLEVCEAHGLPRPVVSQPRYNWLDRAVEAEHLPLCRAASIAVTPYQPLAGGLLTGKYESTTGVPAASRASESNWLQAPDSAMLCRLNAFSAEADAHRMPEAQYAVKWLLRQPGVTSVVAGCKSVEQLASLVAEDT